MHFVDNRDDRKMTEVAFGAQPARNERGGKEGRSDGFILRSNADLSVDEEEDDIGLLDGVFGLFVDLLFNSVCEVKEGETTS